MRRFAASAAFWNLKSWDVQLGIFGVGTAHGIRVDMHVLPFPMVLRSKTLLEIQIERSKANVPKLDLLIQGC